MGQILLPIRVLLAEITFVLEKNMLNFFIFFSHIENKKNFFDKTESTPEGIKTIIFLYSP